MNKALGATLCLASIAAVGAAAGPTQAHARQANCRVGVGTPYLTEDGMIRVTGIRTGCADQATLRIRLWKSLPGPDRAVKSGVKALRNGRLTVAVRCANGTFTAIVADNRGHTSRSRTVRLTCRPAAESSSDQVGTALENEVVRLTNLERAKVGCGPVKHDARLRTAAYRHSADMSAKGYFSHTSPTGEGMDDRITAAGYPWWGIAENIAKGQRTPEEVVSAWMNSPGHRHNIVTCAYTDIGVGYVKEGGPYWTQDFGTPRS